MSIRIREAHGATQNNRIILDRRQRVGETQRDDIEQLAQDVLTKETNGLKGLKITYLGELPLQDNLTLKYPVVLLTGSFPSSLSLAAISRAALQLAELGISTVLPVASEKDNVVYLSEKNLANEDLFVATQAILEGNGLGEKVRNIRIVEAEDMLGRYVLFSGEIAASEHGAFSNVKSELWGRLLLTPSVNWKEGPDIFSDTNPISITPLELNSN